MSNTVDFVYWISVPHFRPKSLYWMLPAIEVSCTRSRFCIPSEFRASETISTFSSAIPPGTVMSMAAGVGERLVRPYRDFMRGVDVLVGPVERRGRNGGRGQRADLFLVEDTRLERLVGTVDLYGGHLFGGGDDVQIQVVIARQDIEEGVQLSCGRCRPAVEVYQNRLRPFFRVECGCGGLSLCQVEIQGFGRQEIVAFRRQQHAANRVGGRIGQVEIQDRRQPLHIEADPFAAVIDAFR